jgi:phospholipid/cholesterol/gamma-HCH transport system substrate-binding protein
VLKIKRQYSIALMVLGGIVLLVVGINYLKGIDLFKRHKTFYAVYSDVAGIDNSTPVLFHGFKVGQVLRTELMPDGSGRIAVTLEIDEPRLRVSQDAKAELFNADFFSRAVRLEMGTSAVEAQSGDTLSGQAELSLGESVTAQIDPLKRKAEGMLASVDSVLNSLQLILNKGARGDIDASFTNLRSTLEHINSTTRRLDALIAKESSTVSSILGNVDKVSSNLAAHNDELGHIFSNLDSATAALANGRLERLMDNLEATSTGLRSTMDKINGGQGSLGKLMTDDSLYINLNSASRQMDLLLEDVRLNPHRYLSVFGRKDKLPKLSRSDIERIQEAYPPKTSP